MVMLKNLPRCFMAYALLAACMAVPLSGASAKTAQCRIESGGKVAFSGACQFVPDSGGSFGLLNLDKQRPLYGSILSVSVFITAPGEAEVRGLTRDGINSRWGEAKRSRQNPECWVGEDFAVCAR